MINFPSLILTCLTLLTQSPPLLPSPLNITAGLACALETRQSRLAYYVKELAHKLSQEPCKDKILAFLHATGCRTPQPDIPRPSFSHNDEKGERGSSEEVGTAPAAGTQPIGLSTIRLSSAGYEAETPKARPSFAVMAEQMAHLVPLLINGITVIKVGNLGWLLTVCICLWFICPHFLFILTT